MNIGKIKNWICVYGLKNTVLRGMYCSFPVLPVVNNELLRRMNWQMKVRSKLKHYIVIEEDKPELENVNPYKNTVWCMWFQGLDKAPAIVKTCINSIEKYCSEAGYTFILLTTDNMFEYVHLPEEIIGKWKKGRIGNANFSDLCRVSLLAEYGGLWLDATVYLTDIIDRDILETEIFMFQASFLDMTATKISNWCMFAKEAGNSFMLSLKSSMCNYWKHNNFIDDYFIFHLMAAELSEQDRLKEIFDGIPFLSNTNPQLLGRILNKKYDKNEYEHILRCSSIHKLSYKGIDEEKSETYYKYIIKECKK